MKFFFETYGCQMNTAESAALAIVLKERGWAAARGAEDADLVIINTCSVRETAEERVLGRLAFYAAEKKKRPSFAVAVAGCMASRMGEKLKDVAPAVDFVIGTNERENFPLILEAMERSASSLPKELVNQPAAAFRFADFHAEEGAFRSFAPIMHGCNNFCSYCIVPYVRGREISRSPAEILAEMRLLADKGVREITFLGQNVNSYHYDDPSTGKTTDFPTLLELVADEAERTEGKIRRVRFLSSHPKDLSPHAVRVLAEREVFCRHLHLCAQHGSNRILSAMNRRYTREHYLELVAHLRGAISDISLSTDLLVGFPGETESDFEEILSLMEEVKFLYAYMYHYNPREGTAAFDLPDRIPYAVKQKRLARVIALQKQHTAKRLAERLGRREELLIEGVSKRNPKELIGRTGRDETVVLAGDPSLIGKFVYATLDSLKGNTFRSKEAALCGV